MVLFLAGAAIVFLMTLFFLFGQSPNLREPADTFLSLVKQVQPQEAYLATSSIFQASNTYPDFLSFLEQGGLKDHQAVTWKNTTVKGDTGTLTGIMQTGDEKVLPLVMEFARESTGWKVTHVRTTNNPTTLPALPTDQEIIRMTRESMALFSDAVAAGSFSTFHGSISQAWQKQVTIEQLEQTFRELIQNKVDLSFVKTAMPVPEQAPFIDTYGSLVLKEKYEQQQLPLRVQLKYKYESGTWKLFGIELSVQ